MTSPAPAADTASVTNPGPPPPTPTGMPTSSERFFSWVRGLGVVRVDGWLGGVCAGIAARLRIDPLIVRGIVVVATILGVPMFFLYAIAWALLPDLRGRIHLQELFRGRWDSAMTGILILALVNLLPLLQWVWSLVLLPLWGGLTGNAYLFTGFDIWSLLPSGLALLIGWGLALVVIGGVVFIVVRAARGRRISRADSDPRRAYADLAAPGSAEAPSSGDGASAAFAAPLGATDAELLAPLAEDSAPLADAPAPEPSRPAGPATDADIAAWREQHEAWRAQNDAWRRAQQDAGRAVRDEARRERAAAGAVFAAEAEERRRVRRITAPRTSFAVVAFVLGAALVAGAATAMWGSVDPDFAIAVGIFAAVLVVGVAMVVAGALRRRTGFLAFVAILLLLGGASATTAGALRGINFGNYTINSYSPTNGTFVHAWGSLSIDVLDLRTTDVTGPIRVEKRAGDTTIYLSPGVELELTVTTTSASIEWLRINRADGGEIASGTFPTQPIADGRSRLKTVVASTETPITSQQRVILDQDAGRVDVIIRES